jgi:hypothetical protein
MRRFIFGLSLVLCVMAACQQNQSGSGPSQTPKSDAAADALMLNVPAGCPPDAGNELGIGKPCSKTGNQCAGSTLTCTCGDFGVPLPANMPCFCTNLKPGASCPANPNCGSNAICCSIMGLVTGCVPNACLVSNQCPIFQ